MHKRMSPHGDYDHMGEAENLIKNFEVDHVIFNKNEYNTLERDLIELLEKEKVEYFKSKEQLQINKYKFRFLNNTIYEKGSENENSNIIYFRFNKYQFLLMGDATSNNEEEILRRYKLRNITFLKVGHHGSKTSSSEEFIAAINPKISLISVGKNNRYGHPNTEILDNLDKTITFRQMRWGV